MNRAVIGTDKTPLLTDLPERFLLAGRTDFLAQANIPQKRLAKATTLDFTKDKLNLLQNLDYPKATKILDVLEASSPGGENTLTLKYSRDQILTALTEHPKRFDKLIPKTKETADAFTMIHRIFLSPILSGFLDSSRPTNFRLDGIVLVPLDGLPSYDRFFVVNALASQYPHTVIVPDFGQYGCDLHLELLEEERLWAGVNFLDETLYRNQLLLIDDRIGSHCTYRDAIELAEAAGLKPDPTRVDNPYNKFIDKAMGG